MITVDSVGKSGIFCLGTGITIYKTSNEKVHVLKANPYSQLCGEDTFRSYGSRDVN